MHRKTLLLAILTAALLDGCAASAHVGGSASVTAPDLVYVSPGVQVIADYSEPIFYSDSYYWRFDGNVWYRSRAYTSGWVRYQAPVAILRIDRPSAYVHYRGAARATASTAQPTPAVAHEQRDDVKKAQKEERKDQKEQRKDQQEERNERNDNAKKGKH
jgi:hypothetical protein